jgi:hypothetical protein
VSITFIISDIKGYEYFRVITSVVDRHRFDVDPDPNFHVDAGPDPDWHKQTMPIRSFSLKKLSAFLES